jgi:Cu(I)/Ag(I) efflux system membrane fusion protein
MRSTRSACTAAWDRRRRAASAGSPGAEDPTSSIAAGEAATRRHIKEGIKAGDVDPATGKPILYYHDPMVPGNKFDARPSRRSWT